MQAFFIFCNEWYDTTLLFWPGIAATCILQVTSVLLFLLQRMLLQLCILWNLPLASSIQEMLSAVLYLFCVFQGSNKEWHTAFILLSGLLLLFYLPLVASIKETRKSIILPKLSRVRLVLILRLRMYKVVNFLQKKFSLPQTLWHLLKGLINLIDCLWWNSSWVSRNWRPKKFKDPMKTKTLRKRTRPKKWRPQN